jgi:hypothetical protein
MDRLARDGCAAGQCRSVERVRILSVVLRALRLAVIRDRVQQPVVQEPQGRVIGVAKSAARFADLVEHRLQTSETGDGAKNAADRTLLLPKRLKLGGWIELLLAGHDVSHGAANERTPRACRARGVRPPNPEGAAAASRRGSPWRCRADPCSRG